VGSGDDRQLKFSQPRAFVFPLLKVFPYTKNLNFFTIFYDFPLDKEMGVV
jgi:hypothetical protein